jgi:hypothetical protein
MEITTPLDDPTNEFQSAGSPIGTTASDVTFDLDSVFTQLFSTGCSADDRVTLTFATQSVPRSLRALE